MSELLDKRIFVAGHKGLVGSAFVRRLRALGCKSFLLRSSSELDLRNQADVRKFFENERPQVVFLAAAKVGGIVANNTRRAEFIYDNLMIAANVVDAAYENETEWLLNLGSSCIYPKHAEQPMKESQLLAGFLEQTNEPYAVAKIAALKMVESYNRQYGTKYFSAMPTNLYGPFDNFDLNGSHVIPAMIRKFFYAKSEGLNEVVLWGDGSPRREFLFVDDLASAGLFLYEARESLDAPGFFLNVGCGEDLTIRELATLIAKVVGFTGEIEWDTSKPSGTPRKLMDVSKLKALGWKAETDLERGLRITCEWFRSALSSSGGELRL